MVNRSSSFVKLKHIQSSSATHTPPNSCCICDQPTKYFHYDVPSCTSCKTFFRRILLLHQSYNCEKEKNCTNLIECRACRFEKCIIVGMNPMAIKFPDYVDVQRLMQDFNGKRYRLIQKLNLKKSMELKEAIYYKILNQLLLVESRLKRIRESTVCPQAMFSQKSINDLILSTHNELASTQIYELSVHSKPNLESKFKCNVPHYLQLGVLLSVEMAKTLPVFPNLSFKTQETMVRHLSLVNTILLDGYYSYELHKKNIVFPNETLMLNNIEKASCASLCRDSRIGKKIKEYKTGLCRSIMLPIWRIGLSVEEFVLLKAIIYSNAVVGDVDAADKKLLDQENKRFSNMLFLYLQKKLGTAAGAKKFAELILLIDSLLRSAQTAREFHVMIHSVLGLKDDFSPFFHSVMHV